MERIRMEVEMILNVLVELIDNNPWQTRQGTPAAEYIKELAVDIASNGLLQNPMGRLTLDGRTLNQAEIEAAALLGDLEEGIRVQLAFGHNRLTAYRWLCDRTVIDGIEGDYRRMPVEIRVLDDEHMADAAWSENEKRRDLSPVERAKALQKALDDFGYTHESLAQRRGMSRAALSNALRLLKLPADVQTMLHSGQISERQGTALLPLFDVDAKTAQNYDFSFTIAAIVGCAREGESSEKLRQRVSEATQWLEKRMQPELDSSQHPAASSQQPAGSHQPSAVSSQQPEERVRVEVRNFAEPEAEARPAPQAALPEQAREDELEDAPESAAEIPEQVIVPEAVTGEVDFGKSTIVLTITIWPENGQGPRPVVLGGRINNDPPVMRMTNLEAVTLDQALAEMVEQFRKQMEGR